MPDITIRNTLAAAATSAAADVSENFYSPVASPGAPDTLEVINGHLDEDNLDASENLTHRDVQAGTFVRAGQVGGNSAFDVFDDLFGRNNFYASLDEDLISGGERRDLIPIPGSCIRFYNPWAANTLLLTWSIFAATDLVLVANTYAGGITYTLGDVYAAPIYMFLDKALTGGWAQRRVAPASVFDANPGSGADWQRDSRLDQRWNGHYSEANVSVGWHTAGLYIGVADARTAGPNGNDVAQQARVRCRSMRYLLFRG